MNIKLATACFVFSALLAPVAAVHSGDDRDAARTPPGTFVKDSAITVKVKAKLATQKMPMVKVDTDAAGAVVLSGNVKSQEDADKAVATARGTEGVTSVTNQLKIKKAEKED